MNKTSKPDKTAVRSSKLVDALEVARNHVYKLRKKARAVERRVEAQDWCDAQVMLEQAIAMERDRASTITVKELREILSSAADNLIIVLSRDEEGNGYMPLRSIYAGQFIDGEIHDEIEGGQDALVFYP